MTQPPQRLRIAVIQTAGVPLHAWRATMAAVGELAERAAEDADLVLLPECAWPAYWLGSWDDYRDSRAAGMPSADDFLDLLAAIASRRRVHVCAGYVAEEDGQLFNRAAIIDPQGEILGTYDKTFLWSFDRNWFTPGREIRPIQTTFGPVGLLICADARIPEIAATLVARGARLLLQPTAWVNGGRPDHLWNPQPDFLVPTRARECGVPMASASKCGSEGDTTFVGSSLICDAHGRKLAVCDANRPGVAVAEVALADPRPRRRILRRWRLGPDFTRPPHFEQTARLSVARLRPAVEGAPAAEHASGGTLLCRVAMRSAQDAPSTGEISHDIELYGPTESVVGCGRLRLAAIAARHTHHFALARSLALQGIHLLIVFGRARPQSLRARAAENRIFVVAVSDAPQAYDPRGLPIDGHASLGDDELLGLTFDPGQAVSKEVAPGTDVFAGRRVDLYEF